MVRCSHCGDDTPVIRDPDKGYIICGYCGKILDQDLYATEPTFIKDSSGQSRLAGTILNSVQSGYSASHERTLLKGRDEIRDIVNSLRVGGGDSIINKAHAFYQIAVDKNFTRGRRTSHVAAACLYIACRQTKKAYLLIDFSDYLQINVYVLGAVFLQLCKTLSLAEHPIVQKLIDPSLFIHRFTERLLCRKNNAVSETALRIVASMKRDWMQTGRKPSGLCGAALYISALSHGLNYSKSEIVSVVHICEATLTKRLIEFENTESGCLTIEEFLTRADELSEESHSSQLPKAGEVMCKHKDKASHFAHGLCKKCYDKFIKISGGLQGGAKPPAFQRAERKRMEEAKKEEKIRESSHDSQEKKGAKVSAKVTSNETGYESQTSKEHESVGHQAANESACNESQEPDDQPAATAGNESESFSDIDDVEVDGYLHNEEEKHFKKIIWEEMNREYLEEQAAKEAAAAAAKEAYEANFADSSEDLLAARELATATAAALAKSKKERKQKRAEEAKNSTPARTPLEATRQMLKRKTFSSRVNYEALEGLYTTDQENGKKQKVESDTGEANGHPDNIKERVNSGTADDGDEAGTFEDGDFAEEADYNDYYGNGDEDYTYDADYGYD
ncbi:transcription factor IIIB 90 kDa subunit isoform X2 [Phoenix dactylifera]|uniref:B-related factor 1 n=1 Tax=Phoenix dactylifera TaxID=42345 RepID=A0A8B7C4Y3_PHODC|nr:transcription factor IIIB 90 kDa subunit isoform X2 [Phoenix dactylifera]